MTAEELLMTEDVPTVTHRSGDIYCIISADTRSILIPTQYAVLGVESDESVNRVLFKCPKIVGDNVDLTKLQLNVNFRNANGDKDRYIVTDIETDSLDVEYITFSWVLSRKSTGYKGKVSFIVCAVNVDSAGTIKNEWNTTLASSTVLEGLEVGEVIVEQEEKDVITQLINVVTIKVTQAAQEIDESTSDALTQIDNKGTAKVKEVESAGGVQLGLIQSEGAAQRQSVERVGAGVLASIPAEYTALNDLVEEIDNSMAGGIVKPAQGGRIELYDSADRRLKGMQLFGKSTQETTKGTNLLDMGNAIGGIDNGITGTILSDGKISIVGSKTSNSIAINIWLLGGYLVNPDDSDKVLFTVPSGRVYIEGVVLTTVKTNGFVGYEKTKENNGFIDFKEDDERRITGVRVQSIEGIAGTKVNMLLKPMVTKVVSDVVPEWEKYTGGAPSPSPFYPQPISSVGDSGTLEILTTGANLINYNKMPTQTQTSTNPVNTLTIQNNNNGTFTILGSGTFNNNGYIMYVFYKKEKAKMLLKQGNVVLHSYEITRPYMNASIYDIITKLDIYLDGSGKYKATRIDKRFYEESDISFTYFFYHPLNKTITPATVNPMLTQMDVTDFEPYKETRASLTLLEPLRALKSNDSRGNYTDENGQKWICDTIELYPDGTGKRINRVGVVDNDTWALSNIQAGGKGHRFVVAPRNFGILSTSIDSTIPLCMCSNYIFSNGGSFSVEGDYIAANEYAIGAIHIRTLKKDFEDKSAFINYARETGMLTLYELKNKEEIPLTKAEVAELQKLRTFKPTTMIVNDSDNMCDMSIEYVADTKTYIDNDLNDIRELFGLNKSGYILGLQVDYENKTFKRLSQARNLQEGKDFNKFSIYGGRKRCNVLDNGTITAYYGDSSYKEDGSNGQVMVYQPKFYYKVVPLKTDPITDGIGQHLRKANYYVSNVKSEGFKLHPAFINEAGKEIDYILFSAYEGSLYDTSANIYLKNDEQVLDPATDKLCSIAGVKPVSGNAQDLTRPKVEQIAQNRGAGWHGDLIKAESANQLLMIIELGLMNIQTAIAHGVVSVPDIPNTENNSVITGGTSTLGNATGQAPGTNGQASVTYRGVENPWGNICKFVYGVNIYGNGSMKGGVPYICSDFAFAESKNSDNYVSAGFTVANANGYISAMGYSEEFDYLFFPSECAGNSSLPVGDYIYTTPNLNGYRIARLGGSYGDSDGSGGFYCHLNYGVGHRARGTGCRLIYMKQ